MKTFLSILIGVATAFAIINPSIFKETSFCDELVEDNGASEDIVVHEVINVTWFGMYRYPCELSGTKYRVINDENGPVFFDRPNGTRVFVRPIPTGWNGDWEPQNKPVKD